MTEQKYDLNTLAKRVTETEGGKQSLSIAQVKEVLGILGDVMSADPYWGLALIVRSEKNHDGKIAKLLAFKATVAEAYRKAVRARQEWKKEQASKHLQIPVRTAAPKTPKENAK